MNQWKNESCSSSGEIPSSSMYMDDKNNNSSCFNGSGVVVKDEGIDVLVSNSDNGARWTNPNGILNGTNTTASNPTNEIFGKRNINVVGRNMSGGSVGANNISTPSSTMSINTFSAVEVEESRVNEKSPEQVVTASATGNGEKRPFVFQSCVMTSSTTSNTAPATTSQPGVCSSNDGPFQNYWLASPPPPHLRISSESSSSTPPQNLRRNKESGISNNSGEEVLNNNISSSIPPSYTGMGNGGGYSDGRVSNSAGMGGGSKLFGGGGGYTNNNGEGSNSHRIGLGMDEMKGKCNASGIGNALSKFPPTSNNMSGGGSSRMTPMMITPNTATLVGHHHQKQQGSHVNTPAICNNNISTNHPRFSHPSPATENGYHHQLNRYYGSTNIGGGGSSNSNTYEQPLTIKMQQHRNHQDHHHHHNFQEHREELRFSNMNQQRPYHQYPNQKEQFYNFSNTNKENSSRTHVHKRPQTVISKSHFYAIIK